MFDPGLLVVIEKIPVICSNARTNKKFDMLVLAFYFKSLFIPFLKILQRIWSTFIFNVGSFLRFPNPTKIFLGKLLGTSFQKAALRAFLVEAHKEFGVH